MPADPIRVVVDASAPAWAHDLGRQFNAIIAALEARIKALEP